MFLFRCFTFRLVRLRAPRAWSRAALLIALAFCLTGPGAALAAAPARAPERLRVVLPKDYPPFVQEDERGVLQGVLVDVWRLWEKRTGALVELTAMEWPKAQQAVLSGEADVIDSIFFSPEREALYDFSKPSFPMNVTVFVRSGTHVVKNMDELKTRTVGVSAGDACIHLLKAQGVTSLKEYSGEEKVVLAAAAKEVDAFVLDEIPADYFIFRHNLDAAFRRAFVLYKDSFRCAVLKGRTDLLAFVERGFALISENERIAIERRWLRPPSPWRDVLGFLGIAIAAVAGLMLVVFLARRIWPAPEQDRRRERGGRVDG